MGIETRSGEIKSQGQSKESQIEVVAVIHISEEGWKKK